MSLIQPIRDRLKPSFHSSLANFRERIGQPGGFYLTNPPRQLVWNARPAGRPFWFSGVEGIRQVPLILAALELTTMRGHVRGQHHDYRVSTTAIAVCSAAAWWCSLNENADMRSPRIAPGTR